MLYSYLKLAVASLIPVIATLLLFKLDRTKRFGALSYSKKQIFYGIIFGLIAILGTEWGIPLEGAVVNCRDAAPLCAGLFFGGPAGILAGLIGGLERWFAVYWGVGTYTRLACTIATVLAGGIAALLRKYVFEEKQPRLFLAAAAAFSVEALHQSMVFFFHIADAVTATSIVRVTAPSMLVANTLSVFFAGVVYAYADKSLFKAKNELNSLSLIVQKQLLVIVVISFLFTSVYSFSLQTYVDRQRAEDTLRTALNGSVSEEALLAGDTPEELFSAYADGTRISSDVILLLADDSGKVLSCSSGTAPTESLTLPQNEKKTFSFSVEEESMFAVCKHVGAYALVAAMPESTVYTQRNISAFSSFFVQLFIYGLLFAAIALMLRITVLRPLKGVTASLGKIASGNLEQKIDEHGSREFFKLSDDINATVDTLKAYIAEAAARNEKEMAMAREIQLSALPRTFPAFPRRKDLDIYAMTRPAREVGGDFYDFYFANGERLYLLVADVSGKGIPAAMFMMRAKTLLKSIIEAGGSIEEAFARGNNGLCEGNEAEMFVTAWLGEIDMRTGTLTFVNAGHNPPYLLGKDAPLRMLKVKPGFVLAGMEGISYKVNTEKLHRGDRLVLYTDGVTEATNVRNELFGDERLLAVINENKQLSAAALSDKILREVLAFTGEAEQFDDITLLVFDYLGAEADT